MSHTAKTILAVIIVAVVVIIVIFAVRSPRRDMIDTSQADRSSQSVDAQTGASVTSSSPIDSDMNSIDNQMNGMQNDTNNANSSGT